jgi:PST family polysaccharide transporter
MSLRKKTLSGLSWSAGSQGGKQISQFIITAILARLLSPSDFGLLSMATVFTGFIMIFSELGVSGALIHKQDAQESHYSSAFWLNALTGVVLTGVFILTAPWIAAFYQKPELKPILIVLSLNFFLASFTIIQQAILMREMDFRSLMIRDITAVIVAGIVGIALAYYGFGVWSLVIQQLVFTVMSNLLLWTCSRWRPQLLFSLPALKDIFHFSANMTGFQITLYLTRNVDSLLIGKFLGSQALGYYSIAYKLMMFPVQNFTWVVNKVMFPAFSRIQDELEKVRVNYLKMIQVVALISFPIMTYLFVVAPDLIPLVLGERWREAIPLVQIFCFCGMIQSIGSLGGTIYLSQGRADVQFKMGLVSAFLLFVVLLWSVNYGIKAVAFAYTAYYFVWTGISLRIVSRLISLDMAQVYKTLAIPFLITMTALVVVKGFSGFVSLQPLLNVIAVGVLGFITYAVFVFFLDKRSSLIRTNFS